MYVRVKIKQICMRAPYIFFSFLLSHTYLIYRSSVLFTQMPRIRVEFDEYEEYLYRLLL